MSTTIARPTWHRQYLHALGLLIGAVMMVGLVVPAARAQYTSVDATGWEAILAAGHNDKDNYDYAVDDLAMRLQRVGVTQIQMLTSRPNEAGAAGKLISTRAQLESAFVRMGTPPTDACLFFITSHANRNGIELAMESRGRPLTSKQLNDFLDGACRGRPQVIILSGCETGAMLVSSMTWSPNRIIMAAASRGRAAYGAKTSERHLNFERCLMKAYDDGVSTWVQMYQNALPCIQEREDWLRVPASRPDIFVGNRVAHLRIPGR
jgi:hypothetical protein